MDDNNEEVLAFTVENNYNGFSLALSLMQKLDDYPEIEGEGLACHLCH